MLDCIRRQCLPTPRLRRCQVWVLSPMTHQPKPRIETNLKRTTKILLAGLQAVEDPVYGSTLQALGQESTVASRICRNELAARRFGNEAVAKSLGRAADF